MLFDIICKEIRNFSSYAIVQLICVNILLEYPFSQIPKNEHSVCRKGVACKGEGLRLVTEL